jgi:hypothetical protein
MMSSEVIIMIKMMILRTGKEREERCF